MSEEKRLAVLIDSDNVSAKYAQFIMREVEKYGLPTYKRVYGDWEKGGNGWHDPAINYSIMPVQQCSYIAGKNATDFSMIIDAMDILYTGNVDGFVLVTSDSDFTRLAIRLREAGKTVIGVGELKTPRAFTISCNHFCYLNQVCESEGMQDEKTIRHAVIEYVTENDGERIDLAKINAMLTSRFGNINFNELGYKRFSNFVDSFTELKRSNTFVSLSKKKAVSAPNISRPDEKDLVSAISDYFAENKPQRDNMRRIESYLSSRFGKVDYSGFGSKRFAKVIDRLPQFTRDGTTIAPAYTKNAQQEIADKSPQTRENTSAPNIPAREAPERPIPANTAELPDKQLSVNTDKQTAASLPETADTASRISVSKPDTPADTPAKAELDKVTAEITAYAKENMPGGGNIGQLNNSLIGKYGKSYTADLGYADFKSLLNSVGGVLIRRNYIFLSDDNEPTGATIASAEKPASDEDAAVTKPKPAAETEKPDILSVRRAILGFAASTENGGNLAKLGMTLTEKFGMDYLKSLGFSSIRTLCGEVKGTTVRNNKIFLNDDFAEQTENIERFVNDFARRTDGSTSLRALSSKLKEQFEDFDFKNYGFSRFTDFINAIDGVKADRYHVKPETDN